MIQFEFLLLFLFSGTWLYLKLIFLLCLSFRVKWKAFCINWSVVWEYQKESNILAITDSAFANGSSKCSHWIYMSKLAGNKSKGWISGGKKCSFFEKFGVLCFLETPVLRLSLLPYYRGNCKVPWKKLVVPSSHEQTLHECFELSICFMLTSLKHQITISWSVPSGNPTSTHKFFWWNVHYQY